MKNGGLGRTAAGVAIPLDGRPWTAMVLLLVLGCRSEGAPPVVRAEPAVSTPTGVPVAESPAEHLAGSATPVSVPKGLADVAAQFHLTMLGAGWSWVAIDRNKTRFDWSGHTKHDDRESLYSFWMPKLDESTMKFLPQIVESAAANLTRGRPCPPFDQPPEIAKLLGVERVITVCFDPAPYMSEVHRTGVLHGIVSKGALTIVVVLSNNRAGIVPLADEIGARGAS
jgi:hypothetical protein